MTARTTLALAAILFILPGCDSEPAVEWEYLPGEIYETVFGAASGSELRAARVEIDGETVSGEGSVPYGTEIVDGPVAVKAGIPFDVTVYTFTGFCHEAQPSEVAVHGRLATVAVKDRVMIGWCAAVRTFTPRTDRVTFQTPGDAEVVIRGVQVHHFRVGEDYDESRQFDDRELRFPVVVTE